MVHMYLQTKLWFWEALLLTATYTLHCVDGQSQVPCLFSFGDSLSDHGNNNNLLTQAKSNYPPYGIDFPLGPTGRFTNGRTVVDIVGELLGFENFIPPFVNITASNKFEGVNYASGAGGIRIETGTAMGADFSLGKQIANHGIIVSQIAAKLGSFQKAKEYLNKCIYYFNIGSNDYLNNYFLPEHYPSSDIYTPLQYAEILVRQYNLYLEEMHVLGARKFALAGIADLGCTPFALTYLATNETIICVAEINIAVRLFNLRLKSMVATLNGQLTDSKFVLVTPTPFQPPGSPRTAGFSFLNVTCCTTGKVGLCVPNQAPCPIRNLYLFYDQFHPTELFNKIVAIGTYKAITKLMSNSNLLSPTEEHEKLGTDP